jgi:hypothetical protein
MKMLFLTSHGGYDRDSENLENLQLAVLCRQACGQGSLKLKLAKPIKVFTMCFFYALFDNKLTKFKK